MTTPPSTPRILIPKTPLPPTILKEGTIQSYPGETEERAIVRTFMNILRFKAQWMTSNTSIMDELDATIQSAPYTVERKWITDINNDLGLWKGIAVGIGTFVFLRMGPRFFVTHMNTNTATKNSFQSSSSSSSSSPTTRSNTSFPLDRNPYSNSTTTSWTESLLSNKNIPSEQTSTSSSSTNTSIFWKLFKLGLDSFVSLSMAAYGSFYFMDTQYMVQSISKLPLVPGKSLVSELLCDDFIILYQSIPKHKWEHYTTLHEQIQHVTGKKTNLMLIQDFTRNCIKRQRYEEELKQSSLSLSSNIGSSSFSINVLLHDDMEQDKERSKNIVVDDEEEEEENEDGKWLGSSNIVEIPFPGVPEDLDIVIEWKHDLKSNHDDEDFFTEDSAF